MKQISLWLTVLSVGFLVACEADSQAEVADPQETAKARVIIVTPPTTEADMSNEAYADWAAYLNEFSAAHPEFEFLTMTRESFQENTEPSLVINKEHAVLFLRSDAKAALFDGRILESFVYDEGAAFLASDTASLELDYLQVLEQPLHILAPESLE
jgi:hypothetical protein